MTQRVAPDAGLPRKDAQMKRHGAAYERPFVLVVQFQNVVIRAEESEFPDLQPSAPPRSFGASAGDMTAAGAEVDSGLLHLDVSVGTERITGFDVAQAPFERPVVAGDFIPAAHVAFQFQTPDGVHVDVPVPAAKEYGGDNEG